MKIIKKNFFVLFLLSASFSYSQNDTLYFRHFNVNNGLSHRNVSSIIQDSIGFMWYGTQEGLNMFDGYRFFPYKHDPTNTNSLISDDITCLAVQKSGIIWIGTRNKGVNRYDPYTGIFELFQHRTNDPGSLSDDNITSLFYDSIHKFIWIGTMNGLNGYDLKEKKIKTYLNDKNKSGSLNNNMVNCIAENKNGKLFIGLKEGGMDVFDLKSGMFTHFVHNDKEKISISNNEIRSIFVDKKSNVWIATADGLNCLDSAFSTFSIFKHDEKNEFSISSNDVSSVYQDRYGKIWAGTSREGLDVYYPKTGRFYLYSHEKEVPNSLSSNRINTISQGRSGMFWAATSDGGLNAFNPKTLKFNLTVPIPYTDDNNIYEDVNCIFTSWNGKLIIGSKNKGLFIYDPGAHSMKNLVHSETNKNSLCDNNVNCIEASGKQILIGTGNGVNSYDPETGNFIRISSSETGSARTKMHINCFLPDRSGGTYLAISDEGIFFLPANGDLYNPVKMSDGKTLLNGEKDLNNMHFDSDGKIWICSSVNGVFMFEPSSGTVKNFRADDGSPHPLGSNQVNRLAEDKNGTMWFSTNGGGLNALAKGSSNFKCYTVHDGLPGNSIGALLPDKNGNLWAGTDNGICRITFHGDTLFQCRIFDLIDGLPTTEFYESNTCLNDKGRMIFCCKKGIVSFHPDSLRNNQYKPPVVISDFLLNGKIVLPGDSLGLLHTCISMTDQVDLKYDQNSFSFAFTAISFINALKNKYAYKLDGFDKDWIFKPATDRTAAYTNLDPGSYVFHVKASNNDGVWNDVGTSIRIVIASPYYRTWWFYSLCGILAFMICYLIYYVRLQQVLRMQEIRNKISRDLHDHIGSSLSSISISSEVAKKMAENNSPEAATILKDIGESSRQAIDNMSDIVWAINPANDRFSKIIERLRVFASQLFDIKNITLHFDVNESINEMKLPMQYRKNIYLILKEAVCNVAKYSEAQNCYVVIGKNNSIVNISVRDDGKGFSETAATLGGNGLVNMKQRVNELKGDLKISSEVKKGTTLSFRFES